MAMGATPCLSYFRGEMPLARMARSELCSARATRRVARLRASRNLLPSSADTTFYGVFTTRSHRAMVGIFNRSHYEDVLAARVHGTVGTPIWTSRYDQINDFERMLVQNLSLIHISEPTRQAEISYAVF